MAPTTTALISPVHMQGSGVRLSQVTSVTKREQGGRDTKFKMGERDAHNKIPACNSTKSSAERPVRPQDAINSSELMPGMKSPGDAGGERQLAIAEDDKAALYQQIPGGPRDISTELWWGGKLLERRADEKASNYRTFTKQHDPRWKLVTQIVTRDAQSGEIIRDVRLTRPAVSRFDAALKEHKQIMHLQQSGSLQGGSTKGTLARRAWRTLCDTVGGACASLNIIEENPQKQTLQDVSPLAQLLEWAGDLRDRCAHGVHGLGYDDDDEEARRFFDSLPRIKAQDERYVRLHLGRLSRRHTKSSPYMAAEDGRLYYKGKLVNNGGYGDGILRSLRRETAMFGPGCTDTEVPGEGDEDLFGYYDEDRKEFWSPADVPDEGNVDSSTRPDQVAGPPVPEPAAVQANTARRSRQAHISPVRCTGGLTCPECGHSVTYTDSMFCDRCGHPLHEQDPQDVRPEGGESEPAERVKVMKDPGQPTWREYEEHRATHSPFRSWCPHCVAGQATGKPHRARSEKSSIPIFAFDYLHASQVFKENWITVKYDIVLVVNDGTLGVRMDRSSLAITKINDQGCIHDHNEAQPGDAVHLGDRVVAVDGQPIRTLEELTDKLKNGDHEKAFTLAREDKVENATDSRPTESLKILVAKCCKTKCVFAHAVPQKGIDSERYAVDRLVRDLKWLGHTKIVLKSDNEPAILKLLTEVLKDMRVQAVEQVTESHPPAYDPSSNGEIENACRRLGGKLRTLKLDLEARLDRRMPVSHPVIGWLVEHAAWLLTCCHQTDDGRTPYHLARGCRFKRELLSFGEYHLYEVPEGRLAKDLEGKLSARWRPGIFLGCSRDSPEYMVWDVESKTVKASRSLHRAPAQQRWNATHVESICIRPKDALHRAAWQSSIRRERQIRLGRAADDQDGPAVRSEKVEGLTVRRSDIKKFGPTDGCNRCDHLIKWGHARGCDKSHSEECRGRIATELERTAEGRLRLEQVRKRRMKKSKADTESNANPLGAAKAVSTAVGLPSENGVDQEIETDDEYEPNDEDMSDDSDENEDMKSVGEVALMKNEVIRDLLAVTTSMGGNHHRNRRQLRKMARAVVSEIYSPPRVTAAAARLKGLKIDPGVALDLTTTDEYGRPWDFSKKEVQDRAEKLLDEQGPDLIVGSPMCTAHSPWQRINRVRNPMAYKRKKQESRRHLEFVCKIYRRQVEKGKLFLHEHPAQADSWEEECIMKVLTSPGVQSVKMDQCQFGQSTSDGEPVKKETRWMSNCQEVLEHLDRQCSGRGGVCSATMSQHAICSGKTAKEAAVYPFKMCRAILQGLRQHLQKTGRTRDGLNAILPCCETDLDLVEGQERESSWVLSAVAGEATHHGDFYDTVTGQMLKGQLVTEARLTEMGWLKSKNVWTKVPVRESYEKTGKGPISTKWVDTNKGDDEAPNYRSRIVARDVRKKGEDSIFAPTPPLEALRTILSLVATKEYWSERCWHADPESEDRIQISMIDISRAYFNARVTDSDPVYVQLPPEDPDYNKGMCGRLNVHMYGTRQAADRWHCEYAEALEEMGFQRGTSSACVFWHPTKHLISSVHGDDFTTAGSKSSLDWFRKQLEQKYELKEGARLGPGAQDDKEGRVLNRVVKWETEGITYEADPRHQEKLIQELGLESTDNTASAVKAVSTPCLKVTHEQLSSDRPLAADKVSHFRGLAARANYLASDRPDLQYAAKEACRWMQEPKESSVTALKRLARYLIGKPRMLYRYPWQEAFGGDVYADTDWAGCIRTRKSTTGGLIMIGKHLIKSWSSTQPSVTMSSGEAEMVGVTKAAAAALGFRSLLADFGLDWPMRVWTDSTASIGMCSRQGLGKVRHLDTQIMWIQQRIRNHDIDLYKVLGEENPADLMTKASIPADRAEHLLELMGCVFEGGRPESAPTLRREGGVKTFLLQRRRRWEDMMEGPLCQAAIEDMALHILGLPHETWKKIKAERMILVPDEPPEAKEPTDALMEFGERMGSAGAGRERLRLKEPSSPEPGVLNYFGDVKGSGRGRSKEKCVFFNRANSRLAFERPSPVPRLRPWGGAKDLDCS